MTVRTCLHRCTEISISYEEGTAALRCCRSSPAPAQHHSTTAPQHHTSQPTHPRPRTGRPPLTTRPQSSQNHIRLRMPRFPALPCPHARPQARFLGRPRPRPLPAQPTNPAPAHASFCCCRCRCSCPCPSPCPCPWALPFPHCAFPSGSRAPFPHVHSIHVPSRRSVSPRFSHLRHVPKLNLTPPRTCVLCPTGKQHLILPVSAGSGGRLPFFLLPRRHGWPWIASCAPSQQASRYLGGPYLVVA